MESLLNESGDLVVETGNGVVSFPVTDARSSEPNAGSIPRAQEASEGHAANQEASEGHAANQEASEGHAANQEASEGHAANQEASEGNPRGEELGARGDIKSLCVDALGEVPESDRSVDDLIEARRVAVGNTVAG